MSKRNKLKMPRNMIAVAAHNRKAGTVAHRCEVRGNKRSFAKIALRKGGED